MNLIIRLTLCIGLSACLALGQSLHVKIATDEYAPFIDSTKPGKGWMYALTKKVFELRGHTINADFMPWVRAVELSKKGDYDGLLGAFKTKEREQWYLFSDSIVTVRMGLFMRKDRPNPFNGDLDSLKGYIIAKGRGFSVGKEFDTQRDLTIYETNGLSQSIKMTWLKRVDMFVGTEIEAMTELRNLESVYPGIIEGMAFLDPPLSTNTVHLAISRKSPHAEKIVEEFNKGLQALQNDGTYQRLSRISPF